MNRFVVADTLPWVAVTITCMLLIIRNSGDGTPFRKQLHAPSEDVYAFTISNVNIFSLRLLFFWMSRCVQS